jgi:hypothetical protein
LQAVQRPSESQLEHPLGHESHSFDVLLKNSVLSHCKVHNYESELSEYPESQLEQTLLAEHLLQLLGHSTGALTVWLTPCIMTYEGFEAAVQFWLKDPSWMTRENCLFKYCLIS